MVEFGAVAELLQTWADVISRALVRTPQLAAELGLGTWPIAAVALLAGVALLLMGVRLGPLLSGVAGAAGGWLVASRYPAMGASWGIPPATEVWMVVAGAGVACAFVPALYPFLLGVVLGGAWGYGVPVAGHAWLRAVGAALVLGVIAFAARRVVFAATAAIAGAMLMDAALLVLSSRFPLLAALTRRPVLFAAMTAVLIVAGTAAQVSPQPAAGRRAAGIEGSRERRGRRLANDD